MEIIASHTALLLRRLNASDLAQFLAYRNDPQVAQFQSWKPMDHQAASHFLTAMETEPLLAPGEWCQVAIARPSDNLLLGDMGWFLSADATEVELGITLAQSHQGQGIATHAMRLAATQVFARSSADRIVAYADIRNHPSCALMPRAGFTQIGTEVTDGITEHVYEFRRSR